MYLYRVLIYSSVIFRESILEGKTNVYKKIGLDLFIII